MKNDQKNPSYIFDELPLWSAPFGLNLLDNIEYKENITALDIGFGTGFPLIEIAMRLGQNSTVYGIDNQKESIEKANEKIKFYGITNIKIIEGSVEKIPLENNSINLITSNNCINNVDNITQALMECSRILTKDGQFLMTMNLEKTMFEFYNVMEDILLKLDLKTEVELMYKHIEHKRPSVDKILEPMKEKFKIKDIKYDQFSYKFANGTALLNHYFIKLAFRGSWEKLLPENRVKEIFNKIEIKLNELAEKFGGIELSVPFILINSIKKRK